MGLKRERVYVWSGSYDGDGDGDMDGMGGGDVVGNINCGHFLLGMAPSKYLQ